VEFAAVWIARIIAGVMSIADASNLRNRVYEIQDEHEIMWTALDDIARMHKDHPSGAYAKKVMENINRRYDK
jgi:hypothetical protein